MSDTYAEDGRLDREAEREEFEAWCESLDGREGASGGICLTSSRTDACRKCGKSTDDYPPEAQASATLIGGLCWACIFKEGDDV